MVQMAYTINNHSVNIGLIKQSDGQTFEVVQIMNFSNN